ncbi:MAG: hypothetical protein IKX97_02235 [Erysipelotrichaceae bacterium]|nr:hypothetical protein [Erysipelotrichaceae bacterium]MBR5754626.1 hypothetical protein [Erysipelotrichaceae bacterium]
MANNIDMFKLIEEVEKQQKLNVDDIFNDLDSVKDDTTWNTTVQTPRYSNTQDIKLIKRPSIPQDIGTYDTRFEAFRGIIEHVSYGYVEVNAYVEGHRDALEKYYKDAYNNSKDLYVIEARVNDEIQKNVSHSQLYEKGYYDGLFYVLQALNESKKLLMNKINKEINLNL